MSRHRSRSADEPRHGPIQLPEQAPIYARGPLGFPIWIPRGWVMRPIWRTRSARKWLLFMVIAPFAVLALAMIGAALKMLFQ